jgi:hypothetical protein
MKSFVSRFFALVLKLSATLATCLGCSKHEAPPREIHWHGADTGYEGTTVIESDGAAKTGQESRP